MDKKNIIIKITEYISIMISLSTFILVSFIVYKELIYKNKLNNYEKRDVIITSKMSNDVNIDYEEGFDDGYKSIQAIEYIKCLDEKLGYDDLSDRAKLTIDTLDNMYKSSYNYFAFKYVDIYTGFSISYNQDDEIYGASTIKAPSSIYIYEEAERGNIDLDEELTYTSSYYIGGSGLLKNTPFNKSYTVRTLVSYAIIHSDNAAHNMLMDRFGRVNMYNYWTNNFHTTAIFRRNTNWGNITANDASKYMMELYNYYSKGSDLSKELYNNYRDVTFKVITDKDGRTNTLNKSGWGGSSFHDIAIVLDDNPYILVVLTNLGNGNYFYIMNETSKLVGNLHEEYWKIKYDKCLKIING